MSLPMACLCPLYRRFTLGWWVIILIPCHLGLKKNYLSFKRLHKNVEISIFSFYLLWWWNTWIWNLVIPWGKNRVPISIGKQDRPMVSSHLWHCDAAFLGQLLFGFFTGVGVTEVWVKIFIQDFCGLFTEVTPFSSMTRTKREL